VALASLQELERDAVMGTYARQPVEFVRGEGTRLWDDEGNEYLDFLTGISVAQLGHCHPRVVDAVREQAGRLMHVGNLFYTEPGMRLAKRLADLSLGGRVFLCNSGAEAIECALKLARKRRPGGKFVVMDGGFHGRTMGALSATPQESKQAPFAPLVPGFRVVPRNDAAALTAAVGDDTAAVLLEPIQGESGIHPLDAELLHAARAACDVHGALLVFDEIQTGVGRCGAFFAWERHGVKPDAVTLAKGLANGLPIGVLLVGDDAPVGFAPGDHGSTFGGNPVSCAAACAVVDTIDDELLASVRSVAALLQEGLSELGPVRGLGLLLGVELDRPAGPVVEAALARGLVVGTAGETTLRLAPPLTITADEAAHAVELLKDVA
jgi:predicted acetylornithine/succinylornithine family transaminase